MSRSDDAGDGGTCTGAEHVSFGGSTIEKQGDIPERDRIYGVDHFFGVMSRCGSVTQRCAVAVELFNGQNLG